MSAPCPALGFRVRMELADAAAADSLRHAWTDLLEGRGLSCAGPLTSGRELIVTSEAAQATESDRAAVRAWLGSRAGLRAWRVGELEDLR